MFRIWQPRKRRIIADSICRKGKEQPEQTIHSAVPRDEKNRKVCLITEVGYLAVSIWAEGNHTKNLSTLHQNTSQNSTSHISLSGSDFALGMSQVTKLNPQDMFQVIAQNHTHKNKNIPKHKKLTAR